MQILLYIFLGVVLLLAAFFAWFFLVFARIPALALAPNDSELDKLAKIDSYLSKLHQAGKFNGAVLLARSHEPLLMKTYGFTDHTLEVPLTQQSAFRLASVAKQFTAAAVLRACYLELLDIDAAASVYLPDFPYPGVTVRHLLNQTSGVPDNYMELAEKHVDEIGEVLTITGVTKLVSRAAVTPEAPPGAQFKYSNTNYVLLAALVEATSGLSFEAFCRQELFQPLGMDNTRVWNLVSSDTTFANKTGSFSKFAGRVAPKYPDFMDGVAGDGAVFSSIEDFLIWDRFWAGNKLVPDHLLEQALRPVKLVDDTTSNYGFGWVVEQDYHWHNGAWLGAMTHVARNPEKQTMLVLLDNSANIRLPEIAEKLEAIWRTL